MLLEQLNKKWKGVLEHDDLPKIASKHRRDVTAQLLETTEKVLRQNAGILGEGSQRLISEASPTNSIGNPTFGADTGAIDTFDPILISLVRRAMPNLMAYDVCGVQPMTGPTGLIFAMRSRYSNNEGTETFYQEVNTAFSTIKAGANTLGDKHTSGATGFGSTTANLAEAGIYNFAGGMQTATLEALGSNSSLVFPEMSFSIEKVPVEAKGRGLKAEYSMELAQDLKSIHGLEAETELANILSGEILAEINREVVRTIYVTAVKGSLTDTVTAGVFDLDTDSSGRWSVEKFKGLMYRIDREANQIAKETRRGKGNILICSSDVASALQMAGILDYAPAVQNALEVDDTGNTFVGVLNGKMKVYIDPYAVGTNFMIVGYKGAHPFDAGLFYCPYVPLQMVRAVDQNTFQPKIGFKTRYGMVANPFAEGSTAGLGVIKKDSNVFYRRSLITNLL